jgi:hypothetical protein
MGLCQQHMIADSVAASGISLRVGGAVSLPRILQAGWFHRKTSPLPGLR